MGLRASLFTLERRAEDRSTLTAERGAFVSRLDAGRDLGGTFTVMNLEDVDRELDTLGATPASPPIERVSDLTAVDALLAALGQGVSLPASAGQATKPSAAKPTGPVKPAAKPYAPAKPAPAPSAAARPPAQKSAMPPPPPKSIVPRVAAAEATRQVVAPDSPKPDTTRQVVAPSPSSPGTLSADDLFADLADDDDSVASEHPNVGERTGEVDTSETVAETAGSPLSELFSDLDEEVADVGNLFEEEAPSEERLSLELGDFDELGPSTGTSVLPSSSPSSPPSRPSASPPAPLSSAPAAPTPAPARSPMRGTNDDFEEPVADSTSLFSAADVAAIRRASSVPAPMPTPTPSSTARSVPPPSTSSALDELVLEDDFELLIDDDESDEESNDDFEEMTELRAPEATSDENESNDDEPDPSGKKGGFFKKLFG